MKGYTTCLATLVALVAPASADPQVTATPSMARPGDAVLVTVTGVTEEPTGKVNGAALAFFRADTGYQAVFAVPLNAKPGPIAIEVDHLAPPAGVAVQAYTFPEARLVVEDEYANPSPTERDQIAADNKAIIDVNRAAKGPALFVLPFRRPPGEVTSTFGEWRTFNDAHRDQHLGVDVFARQGSKVGAVAGGTVVLVRDGFLTGTTVVVAHGAGIASAYFHLDRATVTVGDRVERGAELGRAGRSGRTTGPHLHVGIWVPGGWVDPVTFIQLKLAPARPRTAAR